MLITCLGHAKFKLQLESGYVIVTDPFDASTGYPVGHVRADAVLVSHHHHDHDAVETVAGEPLVVDRAGSFSLAENCRVEALEAFHDEVRGAKRGRTLVFVVEAEGLRVVHMGDIGHMPDDALRRAIGRPDVLMIPVGGFYTVDAQTAKDIAVSLGARTILPMHYRTQYNAGWPIAPAEAFTGLFPSGAETLDLLRVTAEDTVCQPHVALLTPRVE